MKRAFILVAAFVLLLCPAIIFADDVSDAAAVLTSESSTAEELVSACETLGQAKGPDARKALIGFLKSIDADNPTLAGASLAAGDALAAIGGAPVETAMIALLTPTQQVFGDNRYLGPARALGKMNSTRATAPLVTLMKHEFLDGHTWEVIADSLVQIGDKTATPGLVALLRMKDDNPVSHDERRTAALRALGALGSASTCAVVAPLLRDPSDAVRAASFDCLDALGWKPQTDEDRMWVALHDSDWDTLAGFNTKAIAPLLLALSVTDQEDTARKMLASLGEPAVAPLIAGSRGTLVSAETVGTIASVLGDIGATAYDPCVAALGSKDAGIRATAVAALGYLKDPRAVPLIVKYLVKEAAEEPSTIAAEALDRIGPTGLDALYAALAGRDEKARYWAAYAFCARLTADEQRVADTGRASKDRDVRGACAWVLESVGTPTAAAAAAELLDADPAKIEDSKNEWLLLSRITGSTAVDIPQSYLNSGDPKLVTAAELWAGKHRYRILRY